jgi:EpsI family protein
MLLLFWVGSFWREDESPRAEAGKKAAGVATAGVAPGVATETAAGVVDRDATKAMRTGSAGTTGFVATLAGCAVLVAAVPLLARTIERHNVEAAVGRIELSGIGGGWVAVPGEITAWKPYLTTPRESASLAFASGGRQVGVLVALYRGQNAESKLVTTQNLLVRQKDEKWSSRGTARREVSIGGTPVTVEEDILLGPGERLVTWQWYLIDGRATSNDREAKLLQLSSQLRGRGDGGAFIVVFAPYESGDEAAARATLRQFIADAGPAISAAVERALRSGS